MDPRTSLPRAFVMASAVQADPTVLDAYPNRYVFVAVDPGDGFNVASAANQDAAALRTGVFPHLFWCVEALEARGWEPVAWDLQGYNTGVVMRRREVRHVG